MSPSDSKRRRQVHYLLTYNKTISVGIYYYNRSRNAPWGRLSPSIASTLQPPLHLHQSFLNPSSLFRRKSVRHHFPISFHAKIDRISQETILRKWQLQYPRTELHILETG